MTKPTHETLSLSDLRPDPQNARVHTPRTIGSIVDSIHIAGLGRGIVIDENNMILAGEGTVEAAGEALGGACKVIVIEQDKAALTAVRRSGLTPAQKVRLALDDNRAAEHSSFDPAILREMGEMMDLSEMWTSVEFALATLIDEPAPAGPDAEQAAEPSTRHRETSPLILRAGKIKIQLTEDEVNAFAKIAEAWIEKHGSTVGLGGAIAEAIADVINDNARVERETEEPIEEVDTAGGGDDAEEA